MLQWAQSYMDLYASEVTRPLSIRHCTIVSTCVDLGIRWVVYQMQVMEMAHIGCYLPDLHVPTFHKQCFCVLYFFNLA